MQPDLNPVVIDDDRPSFPDPLDDVLASAQSRRARHLIQQLESLKGQSSQPWPVVVHY